MSLFVLLFLATLVIYVALGWRGTDERGHPLQSELSGSFGSSDLYSRQGGSALLSAYDDYASWLTTYTFPLEWQLFTFGSAAVLEVAVLVLPKGGPLRDATELPTLAVLLRGLLQALFLVSASLKFWLVAGLAALVYTRTQQVPHRGDDPLGQTGNGRVFFSGIRLGLDQGASPDDEPVQQVVGVACPAAAPQHVLRDSNLLACLRRFRADNDTTKALASILLAHAEWPFYLPTAGENARAPTHRRADQGLASRTCLLLRAALEVHRELSQLTATPEGAPGCGPQGARLPLVDSLLRVLTAEMQRELSRCPPQVIATVVLATQAGKVLSYSLQGPTWRRASLHTHLDARAVLHSLPAFGRDYSPEERSIIRRALVYAARHNAFGPIRLPVDLSLPARSLRQWAELLLSPPDELPHVAADLQRYALLERSHARWVEHFCTLIQEARAEELHGWTLCDNKLLFVPFEAFLASLRAVVAGDDVQLLHRLMPDAPSQSQHQAKGTPGRRREQAATARAPTESALHAAELAHLAAEFGFPADTLHDWSVLRLIPMSCAWLSSRVGDRTISRSSLVHLVCQTEVTRSGEAGTLRGSPAVVAIRSAKVTERLGTGWDAALPRGARPQVTETKEEYERLIAAGKRPQHETANFGTGGTAEDDVDGP